MVHSGQSVVRALELGLRALRVLLIQLSYFLLIMVIAVEPGRVFLTRSFDIDHFTLLFNCRFLTPHLLCLNDKFSFFVSESGLKY